MKVYHAIGHGPDVVGQENRGYESNAACLALQVGLAGGHDASWWA